MFFILVTMLLWFLLLIPSTLNWVMLLPGSKPTDCLLTWTNVILWFFVKSPIFLPPVKLRLILFLSSRCHIPNVFIDKSLTWKFHIKEIENKVSKCIGIIGTLKFILPCNILRTLYCSLILPHLSYCNIVWANNFHSRVDKLLKLKKTVRIISKAQFREHTRPLFRKLNLLTLTDINNFQQDIFMFKFSNNLLPLTLHNLFQLNRYVHSDNTRSSFKVHIPLVKTTLSQHFVTFSGPVNWNSFPLSLSECQSLALFKHKLKSLLIHQFPQ